MGSQRRISLKTVQLVEAYIHLVDVSYLTGGTWLVGSSLSVGASHVIAMGDQH